MQGYNAQAAAVAGGIVVAADVTANPTDSTMLEPMAARIGAAVARRHRCSAPAWSWPTPATGTSARIERHRHRPGTARRARGHRPQSARPATGAAARTRHRRSRRRLSAAPLQAEQARRVAVIARVIDGELLLRQAAELSHMSIPRVGELKWAWQAAGGPDRIRPHRLAGRPKRPPGPTRAARARHDMDTRLTRPAGRSLYRQRQAIIEPVFGDIKTNRRITRFLRRGHRQRASRVALDPHRPQPHHPPPAHRLNRSPPPTGRGPADPGGPIGQ